MTSNRVHSKLIALANEADKSTVWTNSLFEGLRRLQIDRRGAVGEEFIVYLLERIGKTPKRSPSLDREKKQWDIEVSRDKVKLEIKTATLTVKANTFQHESIEKDRQWNGLILLDIAPNDIYISCLAKKTIAWKNAPGMHRRAQSIAYKYTLKLKDLEQNNKLKTFSDFRHHYNKMLANI